MMYMTRRYFLHVARRHPVKAFHIWRAWRRYKREDAMPRNKPMFLCPVCGKPFMLRAVLMAHIRREHSK